MAFLVGQGPLLLYRFWSGPSFLNYGLWYPAIDSVFTKASAAAWGGNFHFDDIDIASDVADFDLTGGLSQLAAKKLGALQQSRLSVERIETIISNDNPDFFFWLSLKPAEDFTILRWTQSSWKIMQLIIVISYHQPHINSQFYYADYTSVDDRDVTVNTKRPRLAT